MLILLLLNHQMIGGSSAGIFATPFPTVKIIRDDMIERSQFDPYDTEKLQASCGLAKVVAGGKWSAVPAAKMKITRKMGEPSSGVTGGAATTVAPKKPRRRPAQAYEDHGHGGAMGQAFGVIRVCSDCNTTKTPLWRSGPCGPKVLIYLFVSLMAMAPWMLLLAYTAAVSHFMAVPWCSRFATRAASGRGRRGGR